MIEKIRGILYHDLTQAFLKAFFVLGILTAGLWAVHLTLSLLFWDLFIAGGLFGAAVAWGTYFNYTYGGPKVGPFAETAGR